MPNGKAITMHIKTFSRSFRRLAWAVTLIVPLSAVLTACDLDKVLKVNDPDTVNPGTLEDPRALGQVVGGAIRDFQDGYSGSGDAFMAVSALMSDEFYSTGTFTTRTATDRRDQFPIAQGNTSDGAYVNLQFARRALKDAATRLADAEGTSDPDYALLKALEGYTYVALAEGYCGYIPFSEIEDGAYVEGAPISATAALEASLPIFDIAINLGSDLARIGKGRALVNLGRYSEAAAVVASVDTDYVYYLENSSSSSIPSNPFYSLQANGRYSMGQFEGANGLPFRDPSDTDSWDPDNADPRVPWVNDGPGFDPSLGDVAMAKYFSFDDDNILADGVEARLIEAEAALNSGGDWIGILNALRDDSETLIPLRTTMVMDDLTLAPLAATGTPEGDLMLLMEERAWWMWGTGHRLGDLRRLVRNYTMNAEDVYPSGDYHKGAFYGTDVVFLLDFDEGNNTLFDPNSCSPISVQ
jgi:hypothetical protein